MKPSILAILALASAVIPASAITVKSPANGAQLTSPFNVAASTNVCSSQPASTMGYSIDNGPTTITPTAFTAMVQAGQGAHVLHIKCWGKQVHDSVALNITIVPAKTTPPPASAKPAFSPASGTYTSAQAVTLSDSTPGAAIYYTMDGSTPSSSSMRYAGAIQVATSTAINAIAIASGYSSSAVTSASYTVTLPVAPPAFSLPAGTYTAAQSVTLSASTVGASIYYTTDGSVPTAGSLRYSGAIPVSSTMRINAICAAPGFSNSTPASAAYTIMLPTASPAFSLPAGSYTSVQSLTLSSVTPGAAIYYTTDGSAPTTASLRYAGAIQVTASETISAIAVTPGYNNSPTASAAYTVTLTAATPTLSVPAGSYTSAQSVALFDATPGAVLYYTMDGSAPTASSYRYVNAIQVASSETINAIAVVPGYTNSAVASAAYSLRLPAATPAFSVVAGTYTAAQTVTLADPTPQAAIHYTVNGAQPTASSPLYTSPIAVGASQTINAIAVAPGYSNSAVASAAYTIKLASSGPVIPANAISATDLQNDARWKFNHDPGTPGTSVGTKTPVSDPSLSGNAAEFNNSYTNWGGEIYHLTFGYDAAPTNFVYDAQVWIQQGSKIGNLEMDMNQVIPDGDTVIYGFQCDGDHGTWDYSGNVGGISKSNISWFHSNAPCNPAKWAANAWHHVQISYSRDAVGNVTYNSVWLDGVQTTIGVTVPSAKSLGWAHGDLLTNFQIDGVGASGSSLVYVDNLTISRW